MILQVLKQKQRYMAKDKGVLTRKFDIPIFDMSLVLCVDQRPKTLKKKEFQGCVWGGNKSTIILELRILKKDVIAHELIHVINSIFEFTGIQPDVQNDELQAYLMSYLTRLLYKQFRKWNLFIT